MSDRSEGDGVLGAIVVALILVLFVGAAAAFFFVARGGARQQAERARDAEAMARLAAERARAEAARAAAEYAGSETDSARTPTDGSTTSAVEAVLRAQESAWNAGDLDRFMEHYWESDELTFSSAGKTTRGWPNTLARYKERYPTADRMGTLKFHNLEITTLGDTAALVLGQWHLERESGPLEGNFSLVLRRIDGRWVIIHDHTSLLGE